MKLQNILKNILIGSLLFGVPTLFLTACPKKQTVKKTEDETKKDEDEVSSEELDIHGKDFVSTKNLEIVHFEYDSSELKQDAREILVKNSDYLKKNPDLEILCEGHTDERGTVGYNIALGQKRAQIVRKYYSSLGISPKRMGSLSYGKEKPFCLEPSDECHSLNRRVETKVRSSNSEDSKKDKERKTEEDPR